MIQGDFIILHLEKLENYSNIQYLFIVAQNCSFPTMAVALLPLLASIVDAAGSASSRNPMRLWDTAPAVYWNDSYLVGNGRLGAAIGGAAPTDSIFVSEIC